MTENQLHKKADPIEICKRVMQVCNMDDNEKKKFMLLATIPVLMEVFENDVEDDDDSYDQFIDTYMTHYLTYFIRIPSARALNNRDRDLFNHDNDQIYDSELRLIEEIFQHGRRTAEALQRRHKDNLARLERMLAILKKAVELNKIIKE